MVARPQSAPHAASEERRERLHFARQRRWLGSRGKHCYVSFSDAERAELQRYFGAWTEGDETMDLETFKRMLLSLDLAKSPQEIESFAVDLQSDELSFDDFLAMIESRLDLGTVQVFKKMLSGELGDQELDYKTIVGAHRRRFVFDATGARQGAGSILKDSEQIMRNLGTLTEAHLSKGGRRRGALAEPDTPAPVGGMGTMWQVVCQKHGLTPTFSAEERSKHALEKPLSPRSVIQRTISECRVNSKRNTVTTKSLGTRRAGHTFVIDAPCVAAGTPRKELQPQD